MNNSKPQNDNAKATRSYLSVTVKGYFNCFLEM